MNSTNIRTRWAAVGAAIAVTLGAGGLGIARAAVDSGEKPVFVPIEPCRMLDTRTTSPLGAQASLAFDTTVANGDCTAFPDATALSLNVTATNQTAPTFLSLVPGKLPAGPYNASSNLNPVPGEPPTPNAVSVDTDAGTFSIYNNAGNVDVIIDIVGYYQDHNHDDRYHTKAMVEQLIADATPTIDAYTTAETDTLLDAKANTADVYNKPETDGLLAGKANTGDVYTTTELDARLPVAQAHLGYDSGDVIVTGTPGLTATWVAAGDYFDVTLDGVPLDETTHVVQVTPERINFGPATADRTATTFFAGDGNVRVMVWDESAASGLANDVHISIWAL